jgi:hypothetical protein
MKSVGLSSLHSWIRRTFIYLPYAGILFFGRADMAMALFFFEPRKGVKGLSNLSLCSSRLLRGTLFPNYHQQILSQHVQFNLQ